MTGAPVPGHVSGPAMATLIVALLAWQSAYPSCSGGVRRVDRSNRDCLSRRSRECGRRHVARSVSRDNGVHRIPRLTRCVPGGGRREGQSRAVGDAVVPAVLVPAVLTFLVL